MRQAGCQIAIDDFGTGFSALNYLRRYPMDLVKIDRSFILHIPEHVQDRLLLQGLIRMVHNLGMQLRSRGSSVTSSRPSSPTKGVPIPRVTCSANRWLGSHCSIICTGRRPVRPPTSAQPAPPC